MTDDKEMVIKEITLLSIALKTIKAIANPGMGISRDSDNVVYMVSRGLIEEGKAKGLHVSLNNWQRTWLATSIWVSKHWDVDKCLSYLSSHIYFGYGLLYNF